MSFHQGAAAFLYYYLFPFDLNFERYFHFGLIGTKENTVNAYYDEINKIVNDFLSMYSIKDISAFENSIKAIKKNLIEDESIPKIIEEKKKEEMLKLLEHKKMDHQLSKKDLLHILVRNAITII